MEIKNNIRFDGRLTSLDIFEKGKKTTSVGVISPGEYRMLAERHETIKVTTGEMVINGETYSQTGPPCCIPTGPKIILVESLVTYVCIYD